MRTFTCYCSYRNHLVKSHPAGDAHSRGVSCLSDAEVNESAENMEVIEEEQHGDGATDISALGGGDSNETLSFDKGMQIKSS